LLMGPSPAPLGVVEEWLSGELLESEKEGEGRLEFFKAEIRDRLGKEQILEEIEHLPHSW